MFRLTLSTEQMRLIASPAGPALKAARWIKDFHQADYAHIGLLDHNETTSIPDLLPKYGFIRVSRFEWNAVRLLLKTHGPLLARGALSHLAMHESLLQLRELTLTRVAVYEDGDHAIVLNGYLDGPRARVLYRDPSHPFQQFVCDVADVRARLDMSGPVLYLNCMTFPKPCLHVTQAARDEPN